MTVPRSHPSHGPPAVAADAAGGRLRRRISCALVCAGLLLGAPAPFAARAEPAGAPKRAEVTVAVLRNFPPQYSTAPSGEPRGFAVDVMNAVARRSRLRPTYLTFNTWDEMYDMLRTGHADLIPNIGITETRREFAEFTDPVETFSVSLFIRSNSPDIEGVADLRERTVAVVRNNIGVELARQYPGVIARMYNDVEQALAHLLSGSADALIFPEPIVWKFVRAIGLEDRIKTVGPPLLEIKRAMGVSKRREDLLARLNPAIADLLDSAEYQEIYAKWYGQPPSMWSDATLWWAIGGAFGGMVLLMAGWRHQAVLRLNRQLGQESRERARAEEQLRQAQKMEAVGRLAGGVAHDFNNMLQIIQGYVELALGKIGEQTRARGDLEKVLQAAGNATVLTRQLLAFSRSEALQMRPLNVNDLIAHESNMLRRLIGADIELVTQLCDEAPLVQADPGMLGQVLMNLAVNARDAMPGGGRIAIETQPMVADEAFCRLHSWARPGSYVRIAVSDTGIGMSAELQRRIFDPFFTTKESGRGTGLGLSMVYGIVQQHEGMITQYSEEGVGTAFHIYLPRAGGVAPVPVVPARGPAPGGTETILVAEDEREVRGLLVGLLRGAGYQVLTAANGVEAVDLYRANHDLIGLVILDVVMPKLGGRAAYEQMRRVQGDVPILFSTGHTANVIDAEFIAQHSPRLIRKPYSPNELLHSVRQALDEAQVPADAARGTAPSSSAKG